MRQQPKFSKKPRGIRSLKPQRANVGDNCSNRKRPASGLTTVVMDLTLRIMGDKSPKAAHKHAAQKQVKADSAKQKKNNAASAKQVPKTK